MKKFIPTLVIMLLGSTLMAQTVTVVLSQNKCKSNKISELRKMMEENGAPILDDLVEQGKLINWGVLTHAWGDEHNWNVFYVAESHSKFLEAWDEFIARVMENDPDVNEKIGDICWEHKDSIYTQIMGANMNESED